MTIAIAGFLVVTLSFVLVITRQVFAIGALMGQQKEQIKTLTQEVNLLRKIKE